MEALKLVVLAAVLTLAASTQVIPCKGNSENGLDQAVKLSPCKVPPCRLRKGTNQHIRVKFTPEKDVKDVTNHISANVFGQDLPFPGIDGVSICNKIYTEDGKQASCPLQAGNTYVYKDSFPVLPIYPAIEVLIKWALRSAGKDHICFEIPSVISNT